MGRGAGARGGREGQERGKEREEGGRRGMYAYAFSYDMYGSER